MRFGGLRSTLPGGGRERLVLAAICAQILVPGLALIDPPSRFGFQMYSGIGGFDVQVLDSTGRRVTLDLPSLLPGTLRPDLPWMQRLPEYLCAEVPTAARVTVKNDTESQTVKC